MNFDELFLNRRTCHLFSDQKIPDSLLKEIYDISKFGATSFNAQPLRVVFVNSEAQKKLLLDGLMPGNIEATKSAPVTAIFAYDLNFFEKFNITFPGNDGVKGMFSSNSTLATDTAYRNSTLQAAYFMITARAKGLECGPMSGFYEKVINDNFFAGTNFKVNFLCNLGYKKGEDKYPRLPRLDFDLACKIV
ncbi:putative reductase RutE [Candidatus Phycorickettsia trachydisci]|uniref:Putative reductase RutE n=1 Tax=Candidatus Phycorickettsia trachydisci TaxID=2115978 RepID=A0A2P1P855_9RICK|nr:malonic semialdehyde reductase [Candidatus Phycorickettsia trachydisci]AVP87458.1 putative reductase RutE [Candidatus Phycorickettsia trachydisci]